MFVRRLLLPALAILLTACSAERPTAPPPEAVSAPPESVSAPAEAAATVDALAEQYLLAYRQAAGAAAVDGLTSVRATGVTYVDQAQSNRRLVVQAIVPARFRQYEAPVDAASNQLLSIIGLNGEEGWRVGTAQLAGDGLSPDPAVRDRAITKAARQNYINALAGIAPWALRSDPALTLKGFAQATEGDDQGRPVIVISSADGPAGRLVLDAETSLPLKFVALYQTHIRRQGGEYTLYFSDFRQVDGVRLPFAVRREGESGQPTHWSFRAYTVNAALDEAEFAKPVR